MVKICRLITAVMLIVYGCILASQAEARVCFATDPDCGSGGNFGNMDNLNQNDCACIAAGYNCSGTSLAACLKANIKFEIDDMRDWVAKEPISSSGQTLIGKNLTIDKLYPITTTACNPGSLKYYCPYNSACTKCCDPDFNYASCSYPLQIAGKCGDKYKCICDKNKYRYSYDGVGSSTKCENNSTPGGASCAHQVANSSKSGLDIETFYTECKCDRALYPYTPDICDENAEVGDTCIAVDHNGATSKYFSACYCDRQIYQYSAAGCSPYVGDETRGKCSSGGTTYYKACKSCEGYPAQDLEHVGYNNGTPDPEDYEVCPYRQVGNEYKIKACRDPGYRVSKDGDYDVDENGEKIKDKNGNYVKLKAGEKCIPMECEDAVKLYVQKNPSFGIFDGTKLVDYEGNAVSRTIGIIAKDITINSQSNSCSSKNVNRRVCKKFCCKYKYINEHKEEQDISKNQCIKSCCLSDGTNPSLSGNNLCSDGVTTVEPDLWAPGINGTCPTGSSRVCTEIKEVVVNSGDDEDEGEGEQIDYAAYEEDSTCVSAGAYDMSDIPALSTCINDAFVCSNVVTSSVQMPNNGIGCTTATTYYSGEYLGSIYASNSDSVKAVKVACKKAPTVTYNLATFPYNSAKVNTSETMNIYGVNFDFTGATSLANNTLNIYNSKLNGKTRISLNGTVNLYRQQGSPNEENAVVEGKVNINSKFYSSGYNYNADTITVNNQNNWTGVMFSGLNNSERAEVKAKNLIILGIAGFKYVNGNVAKTYVGCTADGPGAAPYSTVTLYNTDWYMYNKDLPSRPKYYLYLNSATVFGYGNNGSSNILFATASRANICVNRTREKHAKNGSHSCNNHVGGPGGNHTFYYVNSYGSRSSVNVGNYGSDWCTSGGDYNNPDEWVDWGVWDGDRNWGFLNGDWDAMYPECM